MKPTASVLLLLCLCLVAPPAEAASHKGKRALVFGFVHPTSLVTEAEAARDLLRLHLANIGYYNVLSEDRTEQAAKQTTELQGATGCDDPLCAYHLGRRGNAEIVIGGLFRSTGDGYALTAKAFDAASRTVLLSASGEMDSDLTNLEDAIKGIAERLSFGATIQIDPDIVQQANYLGDGAPVETTAYPWEDVVMPGDGNGHEFALIPGSEFVIGTKDKANYPESSPEHTVFIDAFEIGVTEVTRAQYRAFLTATDHQAPQVNTGGNGQLPVSNLTHAEAEAYCRWLTLRTGQVHRLPTEREWEAAAAGTERRRYPWGNEFDEEEQTDLALYAGPDALAGDGATSQPVGRATGKTPEGIADLAGNVWEWCRDYYDENAYIDTEYLNPCYCESEFITLHVVRGGSYKSTARNLQTFARGASPSERRSSDIGFRVVREPSAEALAPTPEAEDGKKRRRRDKRRNR